MKDNPIEITQVIDYWGKKFDLTTLNKPDRIRSPWFYALAENYISFNQYSSENFDIKEIKKIFERGNIHHYNIAEARKHLLEKELEYYLASYIFNISWQPRDNSKEIIEVFENFKNEYPNSHYTQYLTTYVKPIIDYHIKITEPINNEKIKLVENYEKIDTFDELIETFQGKKVFVDIWGTWCGPCKREFEHKAGLSRLLKSKNIEALYICEGEISKKNVWSDMIKYYDLEGQHILTNKKLDADITNRFGNNGSFAYPRFLLIDENGIVVNTQASYPSKIKQLEKEINENYVW